MDRVFGAQGADSKETVAQRPTAPRERPAAEASAAHHGRLSATPAGGSSASPGVHQPLDARQVRVETTA